MIDTKYGTPWSREELVLALYLYCQIPFAKTKANNAEVVRFSNLLGRTPTSTARKLGNFGAFDPLLAERGIVGLTHASRADREIWKQFYGRWDDLVSECHALWPAALDAEVQEAIDDSPVISVSDGETERHATVLVRLCQSFFRKSVLASYDYACCICGLDLAPLLIASHIMPWSVGVAQRTDPQNGLCLCSLHDKAFDRGLIAINSDLEVLVSSKIKASKSSFVRLYLTAFEGGKMTLPRRLPPKNDYLDWHSHHIFIL